MAVIEQATTDQYAVYNGDAIEVIPSLPDDSIHLSVYSPPFSGDAGGLFNYSSSPNDLSNCRSMEQFFEHYEFLVREIQRVTMPGRLTAVHAMDTPGKNGDLMDFPGEVIRLHQRLGFRYHARFAIWKEPLRVAIRTRSKGLTHKQLVKDSSWSQNAGADYLLVFRKSGENKIPIVHPGGLQKYVGEREIPEYFTDAKGNSYPATAFMAESHWKDPATNKLAHWIWQQYASSFWTTFVITGYCRTRLHATKTTRNTVILCSLMWSSDASCYGAIPARTSFPLLWGG